MNSCEVLSLDEVRKIAPGAVRASECLYNLVDDAAGTEFTTLVVELVPPPGSQVSAAGAREICDRTIASIMAETSGAQLLSRHRPLPGFGEHSLAQSTTETDEFEETEVTDSATWLQRNVCVNLIFSSREAHPASFNDFLALARVVAERL